MAFGRTGSKDYNGTGDYQDANSDDLSAYSPEDQAYLRNNARTRINGQEVDPYSKNAGFGKFGKRRKDDGSESWGLLKNGEKDASKDPNRAGRGGDKDASLGEKEGNVEAGGYKNNVQGEKAAGKDGKDGKGDAKKGGKFKGKQKGKSKKPLIATLALTLSAGAAGFFGQAAMPFSLISQLQGAYDSIQVSQGMRSKSFLLHQTSNKDVKDCIKAHYFKSDEFKVSKRQKAKLAKSGIGFEDIDGVTVMKHTNSEGVTRTIAADAEIAKKNGYDFFDDIYDADPDFRKSYNDGSRTWRGSIGAWFDTSMEGLLKRLGVKRGVWKEFKKVNSESDKKKMKDTVKENADSDGAETKAHGHEVDEETVMEEDGKTPKTDADGNEEKVKVINDGGNEDVSLKRTDVEMNDDGTIKSTVKLDNKVSKVAQKVSKVSSVVQAAVNIYCAAADIVGAITAIVAAYQALQVIQTASTIFEGIQKTQAGDGDGAPINEIGDSLTQPTKSNYVQVDSVSKTGSTSDGGDAYSANTSSTTRERSAMEANAIGATYGQTAVDTNDPSVKSFNINSAVSETFSGIIGVLGMIGSSATTFRSCTIARLAAAAVGAALDVVNIFVCVFTVGIGCLVDALIDAVAQVGIGFVIGTVISLIVAYMVPHIAQILTRKIATEVAGEDLGNALVSGANMYMGQNHQNSGGGVASKPSLVNYLQERDKVIADNARYERESRSPFDITSQYTFLGSLVNQMIPIASGMTSVTGVVKGFSAVIGNSIKIFNPTSSATSAAIEAQIAEDQTEKNCPDMHEIGAVADAFCNPYIITDTTTINRHPADIVNTVDSLGGLEDTTDGSTKIKEDSKLAKYVLFCGQRTSQWGTADQNIASSVDSGSVGNQYADNAVGAVPVVGDIFDIMGNTSKLKNMGWITGKSCVVGGDDEGVGEQAVSWEDAKYYQRFVEDQRLAETSGVVEKSAVTEYLASYYEKNPVDNSYEGLLARYSGLTKENVELALDVLEIQQFVAEYNPSGLYPYPKAEEEKQKIELQVEHSILAENAIIDSSYIFERRRAQSIA